MFTKNTWRRALLTLAVIGTFGATLTHAADSALTTAPAATATTKPKAITATLELSPNALDMKSLAQNQMGYMPSAVMLVDNKPAGITKEPAYKGKPRYGAFRIGDGLNSVTLFAVDEVKGETGKIYVDLNQNGDLTDDGSGAWDSAKENNGVLNYMSTVSVHASWGSPVKEDEGGTYNLMIYKRHGDSRVGYTKLTARSGKLEVGGKTYSILLAENTSDGIFTVPALAERTRRPVNLLIDIDGDGLYKGATTTVDGKTMRTPEQYSLTDPFQLGGQWWLARPTVSGSQLMFFPVADPGDKIAKGQTPVEEKQLLTVGTAAPDFTVATPEGKPIKLSDFKGKVVVLDFWATWCGPCQASMPGLQKTYDTVRDQGVVVFSVNVFDDKDPFDAWIQKNSGKVYSFTFGYDAAGHDSAKSVASAKFGVSGIPTMYVIGRDGKIAAAIVGSGNEKTLIKVLNDQGIKTKTE